MDIKTLSKLTSLPHSSVLSESKIIEKEMTPTDVYAINLAFSGKLKGGFTAGLHQFAGPSKHFKTLMTLICCKAYMDKYPDAILLFYDNEFGASLEYFESVGIDTSRVIHIPIENVEELKFDMVKKLDAIKREDHIVIAVDSIGNVASKKEVVDAENEKSVADMTRAKHIKSTWRIITPKLTIKDVPVFVVNHTYKSQDFMPTDVVSGGCVVKGTKIQTPNGLKAIEDFTIEDKVLTLNGEGEVTHVWDPTTLEDGNPECYEIEFEDGYTVICSDKHKFLIDGTWVEAKDLVVGLSGDCLNGKSLKIVAINQVGKKPVYDLSVKEAEHYVLENGVVTHNTGIYYSSMNIFIMGRAQEKKGSDVIGYEYKINIAKSRCCKEKTKIPLTVTFEGGVDKYSGLLDIAKDLGFVKLVSGSWYSRVINGVMEDKKWRKKETSSSEFWNDLIENKEFNDAIEQSLLLTGKLCTLDDEDVNINGDLDD